MSAAVPRDSLFDLARHRTHLQQEVEKLEKALQHWRLWDAEYESLKEEVGNLSDSAGKDGISQLRTSFEGDLLKGKDMDEILGDCTKSGEQIINILDRRIDYVTRNIETLDKQLVAAQDKLARASVLADPDLNNDEGEAIMDIFEELDDDDNIISSRVQSAGGAQADAIASALEKAGVREKGSDVAVSAPHVASKPVSRGSVSENVTSPGATSTPLRTTTSGSSSTTPVSNGTKPDPTQPTSIPKPKKSVSFAEDTKPPDNGQKKPPAAPRVVHILKASEDQQEISNQPAIIPKDESPEDSFLRQEMLKYGRQDVSEIGAVVAELSLVDMSDDGDDDWDGEEEEGEDYDEVCEDEDEDDDENQWGMSTKGVLTSDYLRRMEELKQKLGVSASTKQNPSSVIHTDMAEPVSNPQPPQADEVFLPPPNTEKAVRFAPELDIAPVVSHPDPTPAARAQASTNPLSDVIVERSPAMPQNKSRLLSSEKPPRVSRFKQARSDTTTKKMSRTSPSSSQSPLADVVVERSVSSTPKEPDEFDEELLRKEVAVEYSNMRTSFIQRQGGFVQEDTSEYQPLDEEEGGPKRLSRFKAARLSRQ